MSHLSAGKQEFDFWEFVSCSRCHLSFSVDQNGPQIPFWLTECGHVLCNNHLSADQSCALCGSQGIELVPLQRQMDAPMSDWFRSVPYSFDGAANAAKFQQETMASLVRHYKEKCRKTMDRLRSEIEDKRALKKENEDLRRANHRFQQQYMDHREPSGTFNMNGKRPMTGSHRVGTNSSPRSIVTPLGPNRLTIPPGQNAPNFLRQQDENGAHTINEFQEQTQRPGSSRFAEQYAYNPPQTPQMPLPQLSHLQAASNRQFQARQAQEQERTMMPPPPPPPPPANRAVRPTGGGNFKPAGLGRTIQHLPRQSNAGSQQHGHSLPVTREQRQMGPPPTPQSHNQAQNRSAFGHPSAKNQAHPEPQFEATSFVPSINPQSSMSSPRFTGAPSSNRFIPPPAKISSGQRFIPPTSANGSQRFTETIAPGSRAPSRAANLTSSGRSGQRMPFVPGAQSGFG